MDRIDILEDAVIKLTQMVWDMQEESRQGRIVGDVIPTSSHRRHKKAGPLSDVTYTTYCSRLRGYRENYKQTQSPYWKKEVENLEERIRASGRSLPSEKEEVPINVEPPGNIKPEDAAEASDKALGRVIMEMSPNELKERLLASKKGESDAGTSGNNNAA